MVYPLHLVNGLVKMKMQFGDNTQLMTLHTAHLTAYLARVCLYLLHRGGFFVLWKDAQVHVSNTQIRRDTHFTHRDERAAQSARIAQEQCAQVFLDEPFYLL